MKISKIIGICGAVLAFYIGSILWASFFGPYKGSFEPGVIIFTFSITFALVVTLGMALYYKENGWVIAIAIALFMVYGASSIGALLGMLVPISYLIFKVFSFILKKGRNALSKPR